MELRSPGIVFRRQDYKEADRLLSIFTRDLGRVDAVCKGVRKQGAALAGSIEPFQVSDFLFLGKGDLKTLRSAQVTHHFPTLSGDYGAMRCATLIGEIIYHGVPAGEVHTPIFNLFQSSLQMLDFHYHQKLPVDLVFILRFSALIGHGVDYLHCHASEAPLSQGGFYAKGYEGIYSQQFCPQSERISLSPRQLKLLQALCSQPIDILTQLAYDPHDLSVVRNVIHLSIEHILGKELQTLRT